MKGKSTIKATCRIAASMAAANGAAVQDVPYAELRERLAADGQIVNLQK